MFIAVKILLGMIWGAGIMMISVACFPWPTSFAVGVILALAGGGAIGLIPIGRDY